MDQINTILPNMPIAKFTAMIESLGIKGYKCPTKNHLVLFYPQNDRNSRKDVLIKLSKLLITTKYVDDGRSGYLQVPETKARIFMKPSKTTGGFQLKPANLGTNSNKIVDREIPYSSYYQEVINAINDSKGLGEEQKAVLITIVDQSLGKVSTTEMARVLESLGESVTINTIDNDFGEVLGAFGIATNNLLPIDWNSAKVFIPKAGNYPLLDYIIRDKNKEWKISAKSGSSTNTVKPSDIVKMISDSPALTKKYANTTEMGLLNILINNGWKDGPLLGAKYMRRKGFNEVEWAVDSIEYTPEFRQQAENDLVRISRSSLDFTQMVKDAILTSEVYFVKFSLTMGGKMNWHLIRNEPVKDTDTKRIVLRSKNFTGRVNGDKLGFQYR